VEECTYFWGVKSSWGINTTEKKRPLYQEDNQAPQPTNINVVLSQRRVFETIPEHNILINNKERKQYVKQENGNSHQEIIHHIIMTQESRNKIPLYSSKKVTYNLFEHLYNRW
jgi:hypothetical protein